MTSGSHSPPQSAAALQGPSGKTAADESFPVAWLLPRDLRGPVLAFYAFARRADDIADSPALSPDEKLTLLRDMEDDLRAGTGHPVASTLHGVLTERRLANTQLLALLAAFRRDACNPRCVTWHDLMDYCRLSAMPVGRFVLEAAGEDTPAAVAASDALCAALQLLNHVQGCGDDWRTLGRLYIPAAWLNDAGLTPEVLGNSTTPATLRPVLDRVLARTDAVLRDAAPLPGLIAGRRLRMQVEATLSLAHALRRRLAVCDPLADRVKPTRRDWARAFGQALHRGMSR